jgi:hypothetical protein
LEQGGIQAIKHQKEMVDLKEQWHMEKTGMILKERELEEKSRLLIELNSKLANQQLELESERANVVKLQADNQLLQQSLQSKESAVCLQKVQDVKEDCIKKMDEMKDNFQVYSSIHVI